MPGHKRGVDRRHVLTLLLGGALGGCTAGNLPGLFSATPKPTQILISDVEFAPEVNSLDPALAQRLRRSMRGQSDQAVRAEVAQRLSAAINNAVITGLREHNLSASPGNAELAVSGETTLVITGKVKPADAKPRRAVGFGPGKAPLTADVQLVYLSGGLAGRKDLLTFTATAEAPRAARPTGTPPPDNLSPDVEAHAQRLGQAIATRIVAFAREQGWIAAAG
jgi:hypothetical protein